jgi:hypothetical protein
MFPIGFAGTFFYRREHGISCSTPRDDKRAKRVERGKGKWGKRKGTYEFFRVHGHIRRCLITKT